jgi:hypothetical protein
VLAVLALICFVLALFDIPLGGIELSTLGLAFVAAHLAFGSMVPAVPAGRGRSRMRR